MFGKKDHHILSLSPSGVTLARVRSGQVRQCEHAAIDPSEWKEHWHNGLRPLDQTLRQLAARFTSGSISDTTLVYTSPGVSCRVESFEDREDAALTRMHTALLQSSGLGTPTFVEVVGSVKSGDEPRSLTLGASDTDENLQKLYAWARRAGVRAERMIPNTSEIVRQSAQSAARLGGDAATLYIDESCSVIIANSQGAPVLARLTEIGYGALTEVYAHHLNTESEPAPENAETDQGTPVLTRALQSVFREGIPVGDASARAILPLMAPVLQRIGVEVKQTFRFASGVRTPSSITICGPGGAIPGIAAALEHSLDMDVQTDQAAAGYEPDQPMGKGTPSRALCVKPWSRASLLPRAAIEVRTRSGLTKSLKVGALLAALVLGGQYAALSKKRSTVQNRIDALETNITRIENERLDREHARSLAQSLSAAATLMDTRAGDLVEWGSVLSGIAERRGIVRLSEVSGRLGSGNPSITLRGVVDSGPDQGSDSNSVMSAYLTQISELHGVRRVEIERTSRVKTSSNAWGVSFDLKVYLESREGVLSAIAAIGTQEVAP